MTIGSLNNEQQELLDLLRNELAGIIENELTVDNDDDINIKLIKEYLIESENIGNAARLVGLVGFADCCSHLTTNFDQLLQSPGTISSEQFEHARQWSVQLLGYLQYCADKENVDSATTELLMYLQDPNWPMPLSDQDIIAYYDNFSHSAVLLDESEQENFPDIIDDSMVALNIATDLHVELLEGFLIELPGHIQEFSRATSLFITECSQSQLNIAQRIAHTIKGSANVVDIRGIANLMHYSEEVLLLLNDATPPLSTELNNLLIDTIDCLEAMGECVLGSGTAPDNAVETLQSLADFKSLSDFSTDQAHESENIIDTFVAPVDKSLQPEFSDQPPTVENDFPASNTPIDESSTLDPVDDVNYIPSKHQEKDDINSAMENAQKHLRVPNQLISELLKLGGENIIINTRVQTQTELLRTGLEQVTEHQRQILQLAQDFEQLIEVKGVFSHNTDTYEYGGLDRLELERYNELHSLSHRLMEASTDSQELIAQTKVRLDELKSLNIEQSKLNRENQQVMLQTRMVAVSTQSSRFHRCVRQACRLTGKSAQLSIQGDENLIDSSVLNELIGPVTHLLRNAVDHGIETAQKRINAGKPEIGQITLAFERQGESIIIQCSDDGSGLNIEKIKNKAMKLGLINENDKLTPEHLQRLILKPGFSTREKVSQTSGRGIGMDVVVTKLKQLSSNISIESNESMGTCFTLTLPITLLFTQSLIIESGTEKLAIISRGVEQLIYLEEQDLIRVGHQLSYQADNQLYPVYPLENYFKTEPLNSGREPLAEKTKVPSAKVLLLIQISDGQKWGVSVDRVISSQDVVIKPLNRYTYKPKGVIGATVYGDGSVFPVLDLGELLKLKIENNTYGREATATEISSPHVTRLEQRLPLVLVVDDSLSARRSLSQFVVDMGLEVKTAKDGFEAISIIDQSMPALLLVDLEMPRMNGLELTEHVRSRVSTQKIPIIMITSRTTEKHKNMARAAGVNDYISKPFSEDMLLQSIQDQIAC